MVEEAIDDRSSSHLVGEDLGPSLERQVGRKGELRHFKSDYHDPLRELYHLNDAVAAEDCNDLRLREATLAHRWTSFVAVFMEIHSYPRLPILDRR